MASVSVSINFEAEDAADAEAKVAAWKLHEGCNVFVSVSEQLPPAQTDEGGKVVEAPLPEPPTLEPAEPAGEPGEPVGEPPGEAPEAEPKG
jgi:hypothetical protein